ncbi:hypothetical protein INQ41_02740 [Lysobacter ciconiae]|uniref:Lipoprotein n=1 Tax=Novilysobacter ciconiae TaxID=2781022 RepID=A0A7S6UGR3_9GAMM|nr:hypothetical protein [Lysobacter ciconiae]QOW19991.1 hypothetical protein INQ41_02740 [Lysobacter ciconiae]
MNHLRALTVLLCGLAAGTVLPGCDPDTSAPASSSTENRNGSAPPVSSVPPEGNAAPDGDRTVGFHARGNEPFWSVEVAGDKLLYNTPDTQPGVELAATRTDTATDVEFRGVHDGKEFVLIITPGHCEDSMSDQDYDYTASFSDGERQLTGCASAED